MQVFRVNRSELAEHLLEPEAVTQIFLFGGPQGSRIWMETGKNLRECLQKPLPITERPDASVIIDGLRRDRTADLRPFIYQLEDACSPTEFDRHVRASLTHLSDTHNPYTSN